MDLSVHPFWLPKAGNDPSEYEDAFWPPAALRGEASKLRLAVCDGATETSFAASWARILAKAYGNGQLDDGALPEQLPQLRRRWGRYATRKPLAWYAEEKLREGAFAALVGLTIEDRTGADGQAGGGWSALAVGDCCLFQVRDGTLIRSFPLERADQFDNRPALIPSVAADEGLFRDAVRRCSGSWRPGDSFFLMSDALACWSLHARERGDDPIAVLRAVDGPAAFAALIARIAADASGAGYRLRNDDVTLLRCAILDGGGPPR